MSFAPAAAALFPCGVAGSLSGGRGARYGGLERATWQGLQADYPPITARGIDLHHVAKLSPHFSATAAQCCPGGAGTAEEKAVVYDAGATQAWTDPARLEQVAGNLLSHAVRASSVGGRVQLSVEVTETTLCLTVKDDGDGIDAADLAHIFEPLRQGVRKGGTHRGLGRGLAIVRHIDTLSS